MKRFATLFFGLFCLSSCCIGEHSIKPPVLANALSGNLNAVKKFIDSGGDVNIADSSGETLLMMAVVEDHVEIVEYLLKQGANPNLRSKSGETALDITRQGKPKRSTILLENATAINSPYNIDAQRGKAITP